MKKLFILTIGLLLPLLSMGQKLSLNQGTILPKTYFQVISYENKRDNVVIPVSINGQIYHFLLDTGAPFAISQKLYKSIQADSIAVVQVSDANQKSQAAQVVKVAKLSIGKLTFLNSVGIVFSDATEKLMDCQQIDGIIGSNLLRNSVIQFNGRKKTITFSNSTKPFSLRRKYAQKMVLAAGQSNPFIHIYFKKGKRKGDEELLFDTGSDGFYAMSIRSYHFFTKRTDVFDKLAEGVGAYDWGMNGIADYQQQYLIVIPNFNINKATFNNVVATTTADSQSRIGALLLNYGIVTLDYADKKFYFKSYDSVDTHSLSRHPWPVSPILKNRKFVVGMIWDTTLKQDIHIGDPIIKFYGTDFENMSLCDIINFNSSSHQDKYSDNNILVVRDAKTGKIKRIPLKRL